ncbi:hypothetical protein ACS0TY_034487 [Phlomoides rotata]
MKVLLWNIRGVGNDISRNLLKSHCSQHKSDWLVILEPKVSSVDICRKYLRSLNFVFFAEKRLNKLPNIWLFCTIHMAVVATVIGSSEQVIMVSVRHDLCDCTFGFIHATSHYITRRDLWDFISGFRCPNLCLVGDFDVVLRSHERISSRAPNSVSCADFQSFIEQEGLLEVEAAGANFTWVSRRSGQGLVVSKLDRVFAHKCFIEYWDSVYATVLARAGSDHHPIVRHCVKGSSLRPRSFKVYTAWTLDSRFKDLVHKSWEEPLRPPDPISQVMQKLRRLKVELRLWNKDVFGLITTKIADANQALLVVQSQRLHRMKKVRPGINTLYIDRVLSTDQSAICAHIESFYSSLFSGSGVSIDMESVRDLISPSVSVSQCRDLSCIPSFDEVKATVFSLLGDSALGPDGFGGVFFQKMWDLIVGDVVEAVQYFFRFAFIPFGLNSNFVVFNPDKSKAYFGKHVSTQNKAFFRATLRIGSASLPFIYLGVPLFWGAPKAAHLRGTADRIIAKFAGWKGSALSLAGRACLVNSVIVSSLVHSMMVYRCPRSLLQKIDKGVCFEGKGGLGIQSIQMANEAFLQRLAWNILKSEEAAMSFVRAIFFKGKVPRT